MSRTFGKVVTRRIDKHNVAVTAVLTENVKSVFRRSHLLYTLASESFDIGVVGLEVPDALEALDELGVGFRNGDTTRASL